MAELHNTWNVWHQKVAQPDGIRNTSLKLLMLTFCAWCSSDWLIHQLIQAALFASGRIDSFFGQMHGRGPSCCRRLRNDAVFALKGYILVILMTNFHTVKLLWAEIYPFHVAVLVWSNITLLQRSICLWWTQMPCGAHAVNGLLGKNVITDSILYNRHKQLHKSRQLYHQRGASINVLLSVLAESSILVRHPGYFVKRLDSTDSHLLLNDGSHWKSMRRTQQGWKLFDDCNVFDLTDEDVPLFVHAYASSETRHIISLRCGPRVRLEKQEKYIGTSIFGKGREVSI